MGGAYSSHGREVKRIQHCNRKTLREETTRRPRRIWEGNIRMDLTETGWEVLDWMHLAHDTNQWQAPAYTATNFWVP